VTQLRAAANGRLHAICAKLNSTHLSKLTLRFGSGRVRLDAWVAVGNPDRKNRDPGSKFPKVNPGRHSAPESSTSESDPGIKNFTHRTLGTGCYKLQPQGVDSTSVLTVGVPRDEVKSSHTLSERRRIAGSTDVILH